MVGYQANSEISIANLRDSFFQRNDTQLFMFYVVIPAKAGIPINNGDYCLRRNDCKIGCRTFKISILLNLWKFIIELIKKNTIFIFSKPNYALGFRYESSKYNKI